MIIIHFHAISNAPNPPTAYYDLYGDDGLNNYIQVDIR